MDITSTATRLSAVSSRLAPLAERVMTRADVNHDGSVTSAEFTDFLTKLAASLDGDRTAGHATSHASPSAAPAPAPAVAPPLPGGTITASRAALLRLVADNLPKDR